MTEIVTLMEEGFGLTLEGLSLDDADADLTLTHYLGGLRREDLEAGMKTLIFSFRVIKTQVRQLLIYSSSIHQGTIS